jgi:hypothetical protein
VIPDMQVHAGRAAFAGLGPALARVQLQRAELTYNMQPEIVD